MGREGHEKDIWTLSEYPKSLLAMGVGTCPRRDNIEIPFTRYVQTSFVIIAYGLYPIDDDVVRREGS